MLAHYGGAPVEEILVPLLSTGGTLLVAARVVMARLRSHAHRHRST